MPRNKHPGNFFVVLEVVRLWLLRRLLIPLDHHLVLDRLRRHLHRPHRLHPLVYHFHHHFFCLCFHRLVVHWPIGLNHPFLFLIYFDHFQHLFTLHFKLSLFLSSLPSLLLFIPSFAILNQLFVWLSLLSFFISPVKYHVSQHGFHSVFIK